MEFFKKIDELVSGIPDVVIFFVGTMVCYPLSRWVFPHVKSKNVAAWIHIFFGSTLALLITRADIIIILASIVLGYGALYIPSAFYGTIVAFVILFGGHLIMALRPTAWALDFTGLTMVLFQKIMSLCYNLEDGRKLKEKKELKRKRWENVAIFETPSFLHFFAYAITPYGSFSNPFIEYKLFDFMLNRGNYDGNKISKEEHKFALFRFVCSFLWSGAVLFIMDHITYDTFFTGFYAQMPVIIRMFLIPVISGCLALRYFPGWWLVEAGFYEIGLGSCGFVKFDEFSNLSMYIVCQSRTADEWMRTWNHTTHLFWKNYLFTRMLNAGFSAVSANYAVFFFSMAWHGIRPVYYLILPEVYLYLAVDKMWNSVFPQYEDSPWYVVVFHQAWTVITMLYVTSTWYFPWTYQFIEIRKTVYFLPTILSIVLLISLYIIKAFKKTPMKDPNGKPIWKSKFD